MKLQKDIYEKNKNAYKIKKNKTRAGNREDEAGITIQIQNKSQG